MSMGWKGLTTFRLLRLTRDYEDNVLRRKLFVVAVRGEKVEYFPNYEQD